MMRRIDTGSPVGELAGLLSLDRASLLERWQELYGREAPVNISRVLLMRSLAYRMQENTSGGLKPATRRLMEKTKHGPAETVQSSLRPGTRLLREWHGVTHEVIVLEAGVQFKGKQYRSLSEVARIITGVRWSGPLFFGLKKGAV